MFSASNDIHKTVIELAMFAKKKKKKKKSTKCDF